MKIKINLFIMYFIILVSFININAKDTSEHQNQFSNLDVTFMKINSNIKPLRGGSCEWGDFDNDDDLDLLITGRRDIDNLFFTGVYRNAGNDNFELVTDKLPGVAYGKTSWGDYDNDGDLDILLSGYNGTYNDDIVRIFRNDNGVFNSLDISFDKRLNKAIWGDYDNDGDLDIFANAINEGIYLLYKNMGDGTFRQINVEQESKLRSGGIEFVDFDSDGDLDLFITGRIEDNIHSFFYRNEGFGKFEFYDPEIIGVWGKSYPADFGDFDNDGDLDLLIGGLISVNGTEEYQTKIYRNDEGDFIDIHADIINSFAFAGKWGDFDSDGDLDIISSGFNGTGDIVKLYMNEDEEKFTEYNDDFINIADGCFDIGDYDNDGDLDIVIIGSDRGKQNFHSEIYRNEVNIVNEKPNCPINTRSIVNNNTVNLKWDSDQDNETPSNGLSYNIYIGVEEKGNQVLSSHSNNDSGKRLITKIGNANQQYNKIIRNLPGGKYYWAVQSIDHNFNGSEFSEEMTFEIPQIEIVYPNGGEEFEVGDFINIEWTGNNIEKVRIDFSFDDGNSWSNIVHETEVNANFEWQIPNSISEECLIRIISINSTTGVDDNSVGDISNGHFKINDTRLPEVAIENHENILLFNSEKEIQVHAADAAGIKNVQIFYRKGGNADFHDEKMDTYDTQNYFITIQGALTSQLGLEYYVMAIDSNNNENQTDIHTVSIFCNDGLKVQSEFHAGNQGQDYRFFSIPLIMENKTPEDFLNKNSDLSPYDNKLTRLYSFRSNSQEWIEYPQMNELQVGRGFALLTKKTGLKLKAGKGLTIPISEPVKIPLASGWNIIGNPFTFDIQLSHIEFSEGHFELWDFQGNWNEVDKIKAWIGYAVYVENAGDLYIHPEYEVNLGKLSQSLISAKEFYWQSSIKLTTKDDILGEFPFGQHEDAKDSYDNIDRHLPPVLPGQVSLAFLNDNRLLSKDYHKINSDIDIWNFKIMNSTSENELFLNFEHLFNSDTETEIFLIDEDIKIAYNLLENNIINVRTRKSDMNFKLIIGKKEFIKSMKTSVELFPTKYKLYPNFPNPFNPSTQINYSLPENSKIQIDIFNLKGEKLETLVNDFKSFGNYSVVWNAEKYSSGVYLIKMQAGIFSDIKKCMLVK